MAMKVQHDYEPIYLDIYTRLRQGEQLSITKAARDNGIGDGTLRSAMKKDMEIANSAQFATDFVKLYPAWLEKNADEESELPETIEEMQEYIEDLGEDGIYKDERINEMLVVIADNEINTYQEAVEKSGADMDIWYVERWRHKPYQMGYKDKNQEARKLQLNAFQLNYVRREPVSSYPVIRSLTTGTPPKKVIKSNKPTGDTARVLVIADPQVGFTRHLPTGKFSNTFHDRAVLDVILQIAQNNKYDYVIYLGDVLDMSEWGRWAKHPSFFWTTQPSLIEWRWWLEQFQEAQPSAQKYHLQGNHDRFEYAITIHLNAAYDLRPANQIEGHAVYTMPFMLGLDDLGIEFIDGYGNGTSELYLRDWLRFIHAHNAAGVPGATARKIASNSIVTTIFGHIHKDEQISNRIYTREGDIIFTTASTPCSCKNDGSVPGSKRDNNWQQGALDVEFSLDNPQIPTTITRILINGGKAIHNGKVYESRMDEKAMDKWLMGELEKIGQ